MPEEWWAKDKPVDDQWWKKDKPAASAKPLVKPQVSTQPSKHESEYVRQFIRNAAEGLGVQLEVGKTPRGKTGLIRHKATPAEVDRVGLSEELPYLTALPVGRAAQTVAAGVSAYEGIQEARKGNYGTAALNLGLTALPFVPRAVKSVAKKIKGAPAAEEFITDSAFRTPEGKIETGANHPEILKRLGMKGFRSKQSRETEEFGFVTNKGKFVTRQEAHDIAVKTGQKIKEPARPGQIHSNEISQFGDKTKTIGEGRAAKEGQGAQGRQPEHKGVSSGADVPGDKGKVREGEGGQTGRRSSVKPAAEVKGKAQEVAPGKVSAVRERTRRQMAEEGRAAPYVPGKGSNPEQLIARGRELNAKSSPEEHLAMMEKRGKAVEAEDMARLSAYQHELDIAADKAIAASEASPLNTRLQGAANAAKKARDNWYSRISVYRTESGETFRAQQGVVDVDTGQFSYSKFQREFQDVNKGRPMTPEQENAFKSQKKQIDKLQKDLADKQRELDSVLSTEKARSTRGKPLDAATLRTNIEARIKAGTFYQGGKLPKEAGAASFKKAPISTDLVRDIWEYSKATYIDPIAMENKSVNFDDMVNKVAKDLNLEPNVIRDAFSSNKSVKNVTRDMYRLASRRSDVVKRARFWAAEQSTPWYGKWWNRVAGFPMAERVFGHGTVFMETHAGPSMFLPSTWKQYWPRFFDQARFIMSPEKHEIAMRDLVRHERYWDWKRAGLAVDPEKFYDSYQQYGAQFGKIGRRMNLGIDALKVFRLQYAEKSWNALSAVAKEDPDAMKIIADATNHITGTTGKEKQLGGLLFAPSLEIARWQRYRDAMRPILTAASWKSASPAQREMAVQTSKRVLEFGAVYAASLAANDAFQAYRKDDRVNYTDPSRSDWLKHKAFGRTIDTTGGALNPLRLAAKVLWLSAGWSKPTVRGIPSDKRGAILEAGTQYAAGKLNPAIQVGLEAASQESFMGRPLPFSKEAGTPKRPKYTWPEFLASELPIPLAGASEEFYRSLTEQGVDKSTSLAMVKALVAFGAESTGTRVSDIPKKKSTGGGYIVP